MTDDTHTNHVDEVSIYEDTGEIRIVASYPLTDAVRVCYDLHEGDVVTPNTIDLPNSCLEMAQFEQAKRLRNACDMWLDHHGYTISHGNDE